MKVFIGCSSHEKINNNYIEEAKKLAEYLKNKKESLILGGTNGLMGIFTSMFINNNLDITIYCVKDYYDNIENIYPKKVYKTVNDRKNAIIDKASIFIFLPGGIGTIDELFSIIEAKRSKQHNKRIIIVNINNYYDNLLKLLDNMYKENLADKSDENNYITMNNIDEVIKYIEGIDNDE